MSSNVKGFMIILGLVILILAIDFFGNPFRKIQGQDSQDGYYYLKKYEAVYFKKNFDSLLVKLIRDNTDGVSINTVASFIKDRKKCNLLPIIIEKCKDFDEYPEDTIWTTELTYQKRQSSKEMLRFVNGIYASRDSLLLKCK